MRITPKKFTCAHCNKFTLHGKHKHTDENGKVISRLCKPCGIEEDAAWEWYRQEQRRIEAILHDFCDTYACWSHANPHSGLCNNCEMDVMWRELEDQEARAALDVIPDDYLDSIANNFGSYEDDFAGEDNEDPLAGDVDPTGGYYEMTPSPLNTQHYHALEQRGLL